MNATDLLTALRRRDVTVSREADNLVVEGPEGLVTESDIADVRARKADLLRVLGCVAPGTDWDDVAWRAEAMKGQLPTYRRPLPLLVARPERPYTGGACVSCGDLIQAPRCAACIAAVNLTIRRWEQAGEATAP